jgi:hypothetical protein
MANGRFLTRTIGQNEQLASVSLQADFLFSRMVPCLDVEGRMSGNPQLIKSECVPLRPEIPLEQISQLLDELANARDHSGRAVIVRYEIGGRHFLWFPGFEAAQRGLRKKREAPSRLPPPPNDVVASTPELLRSDSGPTPDQLPPKRSEEKLSKEKLSEAIDAPADRADRSLARLASLRDRFFATYYGGATAERRAHVDRQLDETLSQDGCVARRRPRMIVHATMATLANALEATLAEGVEKHDVAIWVVLNKLHSGRCNLELDAQGRTRTEALAAQHRDPAFDPPLGRASDLARARDWLASDSDAYAQLEIEASAQPFTGPTPGAIARRRDEWLDARTVELWREAGSPGGVTEGAPR